MPWSTVSFSLLIKVAKLLRLQGYVALYNARMMSTNPKYPTVFQTTSLEVVWAAENMVEHLAWYPSSCAGTYTSTEGIKRGHNWTNMSQNSLDLRWHCRLSISWEFTKSDLMRCFGREHAIPSPPPALIILGAWNHLSAWKKTTET